MKKFELIVGLIAIFGIFLKIINIPGGGTLITFAFMTLSMFYYVFSFALFNGIRLRDILKKGSYKDTSIKRIIGAVGLGLSFPPIICGGLFKLQLWPGANIYLLTGLVTTGLILLIATIFYFRNKADYYKRIFKRIIIYGGLGLILYLTPTSVFIDIYFGDNPDYAELYKKVLADPNNLELRKQLEQMSEEMWQQELKDGLEKEK